MGQRHMGEAQTSEHRVAQRRYAPKTRTGCVTCKIRRVKCDEAKPFCKRCTGTGRKCDGYIPVGTDGTVVRASRSPSESLAVTLSPTGPSGALDRRTFDFFRSRTAPGLAGYFADPIWERLALQAWHSEPAVRHAVSALGALHEERQLRLSANHAGTDVSRVQTDFPLQQYAMSLQCLQRMLRAGEPDLNVVLLCALIFAHFESMRESYVPALLHAENASKLLKKTAAADLENVDENLIRSFMRLDIQGAVYIGSRVPVMPFFTAATDNDLPPTFQDLAQARDLVETWTDRLFYFLRSTADKHFQDPGNVPLEAFALANELSEVFFQLENLVFEFMNKPDIRLSFREMNGVSLLRARTKLNRIISATCLYSECSIYDAFTKEFEEILTICDHIMSSDDAELRLLCVSVDDGLLHPLYFIVTHCRDSRIRRRAFDVLQRLPARNQRGVWHVEAMTRAAGVVIEYEEALVNKPKGTAVPEDIPEWRRIHSSGFDGPMVPTESGWIRKKLLSGEDGRSLISVDIVQLPIVSDRGFTDTSQLNSSYDQTANEPETDQELTPGQKERLRLLWEFEMPDGMPMGYLDDLFNRTDGSFRQEALGPGFSFDDVKRRPFVFKGLRPLQENYLYKPYLSSLQPHDSHDVLSSCTERPPPTYQRLF